MDSELSTKLDEVISRLVKDRNLAVENLTEYQFTRALKQAIESGDFVRHVTVDGMQQVTYEPYREVSRLREENASLKTQAEGLRNGLLKGIAIAKGEMAPKGAFNQWH